jgi:hypothetical protein
MSPSVDIAMAEYSTGETAAGCWAWVCRDVDKVFTRMRLHRWECQEVRCRPVRVLSIGHGCDGWFLQRAVLIKLELLLARARERGVKAIS